MNLRIASRGSQLALWQAKHVAGLLATMGHTAEIVIIKTTGDKIQDVALSRVGTKGMFTKEIEEAILAGDADLAVHSMKDVPTELLPEFVIAATMEREDARDALLSVRFGSLDELPPRAHVGTSSLRRQAQLKGIRADVQVSPLRGNVDSRIRKLQTGDYDAILLAAAGVKRLGLDELVREHIAPETMLPAVGQGALAIEIIRAKSDIYDIVRLLNHEETESEVQCERALLGALGGGCQVPIAAHAVQHGGELQLHALVARADGSETVRTTQRGVVPETVGEAAAQVLLSRGAQDILSETYDSVVPMPGQP
ncbi:MAG: hydroxymethylbilane synthase [Acidobacteriaceae bacterium]